MSRRSVLIVLVTAAGCGPVQSSTLIVDAASELAAAKTAQADSLAPFEYVAAEAYLHKAREEQSYADFEVAVTYAQKSRDCARVARMLAETATKEAMGSTRATHQTRARCRPGPERLIPIPDPVDEARALKQRPQKAGVSPPPPPPPTPTKPVNPEPTKPEPTKPEPADPQAAEPPLPEGDGE